jgi:hypothetical protein
MAAINCRLTLGGEVKVREEVEVMVRAVVHRVVMAGKVQVVLQGRQEKEGEAREVLGLEAQGRVVGVREVGGWGVKVELLVGAVRVGEGRGAGWVVRAGVSTGRRWGGGTSRPGLSQWQGRLRRTRPWDWCCA